MGSEILRTIPAVVMSIDSLGTLPTRVVIQFLWLYPLIKII